MYKLLKIFLEKGFQKLLFCVLLRTLKKPSKCAYKSIFIEYKDFFNILKKSMSFRASKSFSFALTKVFLSNILDILQDFLIFENTE